MGLSFYYIPRSQNIPPGAAYLNISQTDAICCLVLENTRNLSKKLIESERIAKTSEKPLQN